MSDDPAAQARWLIAAIAAGVRAAGGPGVAQTLARLDQQDLGPALAVERRALPVCRYLAETIAESMLVDAAVAAAAAACADELHWRQTQGYSDSALGPGFMDDYGHCELIGPHGVFAGDDFHLGLLLLGPRRHYRDHYHPAPELYWPLSGRNRWKRDGGAFAELPPGRSIWHEPMVVHATRTGDAPMLAVWAWTRDTHVAARLVEAETAE